MAKATAVFPVVFALFQFSGPMLLTPRTARVSSRIWSSSGQDRTARFVHRSTTDQIKTNTNVVATTAPTLGQSEYVTSKVVVVSEVTALMRTELEVRSVHFVPQASEAVFPE
jgi:hypothetical protein